eukprot:sb/3469089/
MSSYWLFTCFGRLMIVTSPGPPVTVEASPRTQSFTVPPPPPPANHQLSSEFERHLVKRAEENMTVVNPPPQYRQDPVLSVRSSLNSLNLDSYTREPAHEDEGFYDNNRLYPQRSPVVDDGIPEYDGSFALDDLPPPPMELLNVTLDLPPPSPSSRYEANKELSDHPTVKILKIFQVPNLSSSPAQDYYDSLPAKIPDTVITPVTDTPRTDSQEDDSVENNDLLAAIRAGINLRPMKVCV